jgi:non-specific serine/threonine protein kinase
MQMNPLGFPNVAELELPRDLERIETSPAVALLIARVRMGQPAFALTPGNAVCVVEICKRLDGMPLALELAAARFALFSPQQILDRLEHRFSFLASDVAGRDERHRNLLALLDWSHSLLAVEDQRLLSWMSVFVQGWAVEGAIEATTALGFDSARNVDLLARLVDKSFVAVDPGLVPPRYRLLETVRDFALTRLRESGDEMRARDAHLAYVRHMAERSHRDIVGGQMRESVAQLVHEQGNIDAALQYAVVAQRGGDSALAIVGFLLLYLKGGGAYGTYATGPLWYLRALEIPGHADSAERGRASLTLGVITVHVPDTHLDADALLMEAMRIARHNNDRWAEAYANAYRAMQLANRGESEAATGPADTAARIADELGDPLLQGLSGLARGWIRLSQCDYADALATLRAVRNLGHDLHQRHFIDAYIALAAFNVGDDKAAAALWYEAMLTSAALRNVRGIAGTAEGCGYIAARQQRYREAARLLAFASRIRERTHSPFFTFWLAHHDHAERATRLALGAADWATCAEAGRTMREEDAINETAALLRFFSDNTPTNCA